MAEDYNDFIRQFHQLAGIDLANYSRAQMLRRLSSFKQKYQINTLAELLAVLNEDPGMLQECQAKLTIKVSEFMRDRDIWQVFIKKITGMVTSRLPLRFWSAGCANGEEPYTLAFLLAKMLPRPCWEILASDISVRALEMAGAAVYPKKSLKNLTDAERQLLFAKTADGQYEVRAILRDSVFFFNHDLHHDPYPSDLDAILCRNVIIHFTEAAKTQVLHKLVGALKPGGVLFLGGSEQIIAPGEYGLERVDVYIYSKIGQAGSGAV